MMVRDRSSFANLLRDLRLAHGLSQEALAERSGLSTDAVRALERGRRTAPRASTLALLADALELTPDDRAALVTAATPERAGSALTPPPIPRPPDALIGRERELAEIAACFTDGATRLVTLVGPGGVGKTRLALEALAADDVGGVFVDLAAVRDPALVPTTITHAAGARDTGQHDPWQRLLEALRTSTQILVLDNFEQVVDAAPAVSEILAAAPHVRVLVTSRMPLRIRGECQYPVAPLATGPGADGELGSAVRLFIARARAVDPHFVPDDETKATIATICARLDGLPLAIELAAARTAHVRPAMLLDRLDRRLAVLTGGARDMPHRHQTMRAAIDWSYTLLPAEEQTVFRYLAVFRGGCTLDGATDCIDALMRSPNDLLDTFMALLDNSLVVITPDAPDGPRIEMLETVREYAEERLEESGTTTAMRRAHARHFLDLAERADARFAATDQASELTRLEQEHDNLRAALAWCLESDSSMGVRLAAALWQFWWAHGHLSEGRTWLERMLTAAPGPSPARGQALLGAGYLAMQQSDWSAARDYLEQGLELSRALGDDALVARLLGELGWSLTYTAEYCEAQPLLEEALAISRTLPGDPQILESALLNLARLVRHQGDHRTARRLLREALELAEARHAQRSIAAVRVVLGDIDRADGDLQHAEAEYDAALAAARAAGHAPYVAWAVVGLGQVAMWHGETDRARDLIEEGLALYREVGNAHSISFVFHQLGLAAWRADDLNRASAMFREALRMRWHLGVRGNAAASLEGLGLVATGRGDFERAARLFGAAAAARASVGAVANPIEVREVAKASATARATVGADPFARAWSAGEQAPLAATVHEALAEPVTSPH